MYFRRDVGREAIVSRKRSYVILDPFSFNFLMAGFYADVNQFSIITELLGTPPDDVIESIASENVRTIHQITTLPPNLGCADPPICPKSAKA